MNFDPAMALRMLHNERLRRAQGWADYHDLGGALVLTSDAPVSGLNCVVDFTAGEHQVEYLLDVGFALLRAFDREPAAELTPLDRPASLAQHFATRNLRRDGGRLEMIYSGAWSTAEPNPNVDVWTASPDDVRTFADIHSGGGWAKKLDLNSIPGAMLDEENTFYLGYVEGQAVGTLHLLCDQDHVAGIYAASTLKHSRKKGVATTLLLRAIADAKAAGCDLIFLSTDVTNDAQRLYAAAGFEPMFETQMWTTP